MPAHDPAQYLVILMVKLAVAASLASLLTRSSAFHRMLMREDRTLGQRVKMALVSALIFGAGVATRVVTSRLGVNAYQALDLGLEGSLVMGMLGGYVTGLLAGVLIAVPAMFPGELMSMPLFAAVGVLGGLLRDLAPDKGYIWKITLFPDLGLLRLVSKRDPALPVFGIACFGVMLLAELLRSTLAAQFGGRLFVLDAGQGGWLVAAQYATTVFAIVLPIKVWNSSRNERMLEQQQMRLNEARLAALSSQINPHFLFNTLNSVASLIRRDPEQARQMVYRLSKILRRLLRQQENLATLRDELAFIDDYLSIEMVRFGEKLRFTKDVDAACMDLMVPSMLLQPLIENSIRHGLAGKVDGGAITVRAHREGDRLRIVVEDDGVGIPEAKLARLFESGIGVNNVNERLKVLYGDGYKMWIDSRLDEGTSTGIEIPGQASGSVVEAESLAGKP